MEDVTDYRISRRTAEFAHPTVEPEFREVSRLADQAIAKAGTAGTPLSPASHGTRISPPIRCLDFHEARYP